MESFKLLISRCKPGSEVFIRLLILLKFVRYSINRFLNNLISFISCARGMACTNPSIVIWRQKSEKLTPASFAFFLTFWYSEGVYRTVVRLLNTSPGFFFLL